MRDDKYPEDQALLSWGYRGTMCSVVRNRLFDEEVSRMEALKDRFPSMYNNFKDQVGNLNGYARFPKRPVRERGYNGIITYVPAPGGITYAQLYVDGSFVYGYDTAHHAQTSVKFKDASWHQIQIEFMVDAIMIARRLESSYRRARSRAARSIVLSEFERRLTLRAKQVGRSGKAIDILDNFGIMLRLLSGEL